MNREHTCEYDDKHQKSRTQMLQEQLSQLERRLHELEGKASSQSNSPASSPPVFFDFESSYEQPVASSSTYQWPLESFSTSPSPPASSDSGSVDYSVLFQAGDRSPSEGAPASINALMPSTPHDPQSLLSAQAKIELLDIFISHSHQCWFYAHTDRFFAGPGIHSESHPALTNAMCLLACHFARTPNRAELAPAFLLQAQHEINGALDTSDRLVDIVQASALLALYLYMNNRAMEAYRHTFAAARLAVSIGLHQITSQQHQPPLISIPPPRDRAEHDDRVAAFWMVFMVDRCWSVAHDFPLAFPDKNARQCRVLTPWPSAQVDSAEWQGAGFHPPLQMLFEGMDLGAKHYMPALRAKAAALYELTYRSRNGASHLTRWR
ncbi:hypothetical protein H0H81_003007 [Sphagnurus paluster]|uniref:Xylanolytic transcriptional activator regulatory domain-containing protein n=1 Tax=Sphagnurus paluster TaxID=117069 RepID=A0A9P7FLX9_9AGAR|nr:hypothetical protein H0H81_003007 [Sphagnurus paluster]